MNKKIFSIVMNILLVLSLHAERNPLINVDDNDRSGRGIVDIGSINEYKNGASSYNLEILSIPALSREIERDIVPVYRIKEDFDCLIDEYGHETCEADIETCIATSNFNPGSSTYYSASVFTPKIFKIENGTINLSGSVNVCVDHAAYLQAYQKNNIIYIKIITGTHNCGGSGYYNIVSKTLPAGFKAKTVSVKYSAGCLGSGSVNLVVGGSSVMTNSVCGASGAQSPTISINSVLSYSNEFYNCPTGYYDPINNNQLNGNCRKDYSYYTYQCPTDIDAYGNEWVGPLVSSGGDCGGNGIASAKGGVCPNATATPPANNCLRYNYSCPAGDGSNECIAGPNSNSIGENVFEGFIYKIANSTKFTNILVEEMICPEATNQIYNCESSDWTIYEEYCRRPVLSEENVAPINGVCEDNFTLGVNNRCFKTFEGATVLFVNNQYVYNKNAILGYSPDTKSCLAEKETSCLSDTYSYDQTTDTCLRYPTCETNIGGKCYEKPDRNCDAGFAYDSDNNDCRRGRECQLGDITIKIDSNGNNIETCNFKAEQCPTFGFEIDRDIKNFCSKDLEWDYAYCDTQIATEDYCFETVEYSQWTAEGSNNMNWSIVDDNGPAMYQSVNTSGYYLYPESLEDFTMEGKVRVGINCGGNDDDTIGFVFGYQDSNNYFGLGWSGGWTTNGGTSLYGGGSVGLQLIKVSGGVKTVLASLDDSYGWECTTNYTKFKIINSVETGIQVFMNGTRVINYPTDYAGPGKAGYLMVSQGEGYYKDFTIIKAPRCNDRSYTYDALHNICYKKLPGNTYTYDFESKIIIESPSCPVGNYNSETGECITTPFCKSGGIEINNSQGIPICKKEVNFQCLVNNLLYVDNATTHDLFNSSNDYYIGACEVLNPCQDNETLIINNGVQQCSTTQTLTKCPDNYSEFEIAGNTECIAVPKCKEGWYKTNNTCVLNYSWYEYECDSGWGDANEIYKELFNTCKDPANQNLPECLTLYTSGGDCKGSCGFNNCECNSPVAPANSCRKPTTIGSNSNTYSILSKRPLVQHPVSGTTITENDMNVLRNFPCGIDQRHCDYALNRIWGEGSKLCFEKKNKEGSCFEVEGCSFFGEIKPSEADPEDTIRHLSLIDPYTIRSNFFQLMGDLGEPKECRIGVYNEVTKKCNGTIPMDQWTIEGDPASGDWSIRTVDGDEEFYQANNKLNTMYMYPDPLLNKYSISGKINPRINHKNSIGLVFGWESDSSMYIIDWGSKSYWCRNYGNCGLNLNNMSYGALNLIKINSSEEYYGSYMRTGSDLLATNLEPDWNAGNWYDIKATINGGNVKVYINNIKYLDYTLPNGELFPEGRVGFYNLSTPGVSYKDFVVSDMEPECVPYAYFDERDGHCHNYSCQPGYTLDAVTHTCVQAISSTCKMNGNVGWESRTAPIVSIGNSSKMEFVTNMTVTGSADFNDGTTWNGFNAATMAIEFSNGNWYTIANVNSALGPVTIDRPSFVKLLPNNFYSISKSDSYTSDCKYKNIILDNSLCGDRVIIKSPLEKLYVTRIMDIESLKVLYGGISSESLLDNTITLDFLFEGTSDRASLIGNGYVDPLVAPSMDITVQAIDSDYASLNNRIRFWDSYIDGDLGFIEFVSDVATEDREEGYVPEFIDYEELLAAGFTSIRLLSYKDGYLNSEDQKDLGLTYFIRTKKTDSLACTNYANEFSMNKVDPSTFNVLENMKLYASMGIFANSACILSKTGVLIPSASTWAVKSTTYSGNVEYICSPWSCVDHKCSTESCTDDSTGTLLFDGYEANSACTDQICDGNKDFVPFCGKLSGCPVENVTIDPDPNDTTIPCLELYCTQGTLDYKTKTCQVEVCPAGTTRVGDKCEAN